MYLVSVSVLAQVACINLCADRAMPTVHLLDYVAGNIRSLVNAIENAGYSVEWIRSPEDVVPAQVSGHLEWPIVSSGSFITSFSFAYSGLRSSFFLVSAISGTA